MDFGYNFTELYNNELKEINFNIIATFITHGIEIEFRYKGEDYFIVNGASDLGKDDAYWFFGNGKDRVNKYCCRICLFEENEKLIEFLENFMIDGLTLKEIFDEKIFISRKKDKDNCITWIS